MMHGLQSESMMDRRVVGVVLFGVVAVAVVVYCIAVVVGVGVVVVM